MGFLGGMGGGGGATDIIWRAFGGDFRSLLQSKGLRSVRMSEFRKGGGEDIYLFIYLFHYLFHYFNYYFFFFSISRGIILEFFSKFRWSEEYSEVVEEDEDNCLLFFFFFLTEKLIRFLHHYLFFPNSFKKWRDNPSSYVWICTIYVKSHLLVLFASILLYRKVTNGYSFSVWR